MLLVGIDWADDHHDAVIMDEPGNILEAFRFAHDVDGFDQLHQFIRSYEKVPGQVLVAIETKHGLLVHDLVRSKYCVYALNPKAVSRYKDRLRAANTKDDKLDAKTLAHVLRTDRQMHRPLELAEDDYRLLERLCNDLNGVINDITRLSNRILDCLKEHYPAAVGAFGIDTDIFYAFIAKYPAPEDIHSLSLTEFKAFLRSHRYSVPAKAEQIFTHLKRRTPKADRVAAAAGKMKLKSLAEQLVVLRSARKSYESEIKLLLDKLPEADIISSLPGVGKRLTPEITAMFGPNMSDAPKRFEQANAIITLAGAGPVTKQSGKHKSVSVRFACNRAMRRLVRHWAGCSINHSKWAKAFYDWHSKLQEGHETILRKLAAKWIKIAFYLWRTGQSYNEDIHVAALKQRGVPWAMAL
jgi:transposase